MTLVRLEPLGWSPPHFTPPSAEEGFVAAVREAGWTVSADYTFGWEDEQGEHDGFWSVLIHRSEPHGDTVWYYAMTVAPQVYASSHAEGWQLVLDLASDCWGRFKEQQTILETTSTEEET